MRPYVSPSSLVFDVGSNIGQYALWLSSIVNKGKIICYEPDNKNYAYLSFNILINELSNIQVNNIGLSDTVSKQVFYRDTKTGGRPGSLGKKFVGGLFEGCVQEIETSTLDMEIQKHGIPDFIKIDVEGFEYSVLEGLSKPHINTVYFVEVRDSSSSQVYEYFIKHGFNCTLLDSSPSIIIEKAEEIPEFCNLLFKYGE